MNCPVCHNFLVFASTSNYHSCTCDRLKCRIDDDVPDFVYRWSFRFGEHEELELNGNTGVLSIFTLRIKPRPSVGRVPVPDESRLAVVEQVVLMAGLDHLMKS